MADTIRREDGGAVEWLHPTTVMEALLEGACYNGYFYNVYALTLCSAKPLPDQHVHQALLHLFRKVPVLRLCFQPRDGVQWACYMGHQQIDFKVVEGETSEMVEEMATYTYKVTEGPLWCARLLKANDTNSNIRPTRAELETGFPHTRVLLIAANHCISDGTTNIQMLDFLQQILNDVIAGKAIDDNIQMGQYTGSKEIHELLNAQDTLLEKDPKHLAFLLEQHESFHGGKPLLPRVLPSLKDVPPKTRFIQAVLDPDINQKFIDKCKSEGITVNSGIVALLNVSQVDFMQEAGLEQEEYILKTLHAISIRRYLHKSMSKVLGAHTSHLVYKAATPGVWRDSFWDYARRLHQEFYKGLESETLTYMCLARRLHYRDDPYRKVFSVSQSSKLDYIAATMGNLDHLMPTEGDHVRLGDMIRFTSNAFDPLMHMYHTFRGHFYYLVAYSVHLISKEATQRLVDLFVLNFKSLV